MPPAMEAKSLNHWITRKAPPFFLIEVDPGSIPGLGRYPGEGKDYPFQYSGLENSRTLGHKE